MMRPRLQIRHWARGVAAALVAATVVVRSGPVRAAPTPPAATPCGAPEFQKLGEFQLPACGASAGEMSKVSGKVRVTNRTPTEIAHAIVTRKGKILALASVAAAEGNGTEVSFEYAESAASYQVPIDLVIAPKCGPALSISIDRPGRCD